MTIAYKHSGKLGDLIYSLPAVRARGASTFYIEVDGFGGVNSSGAQDLLPLLEIQPYIESVDVWAGQVVDFDLDRFRHHVTDPTRNLADCHLAAVGLETGWRDVAWLTCPKGKRKRQDRVVFARSGRHHGVDGFWKECMANFGDRAVFVGTEEEHADFGTEFGQIPYVPVKDLLELARVIAEAALFVGNQSCPYAIAEGLKKPCIQEVCRAAPNCIFERGDALFVYDEAHLPAIGAFAQTLDGTGLGIDTSREAIIRMHMGLSASDVTSGEFPALQLVPDGALSILYVGTEDRHVVWPGSAIGSRAVHTMILGEEADGWIWRSIITGETLPLDVSNQGPFDCIVLDDLLGRLDRPERLLRTLATWLAPSGSFVCTLPNSRHWSVLLGELVGGAVHVQGTQGPLPRTRETIDVTEEWLLAAGFDIDQRQVVAVADEIAEHRLLQVTTSYGIDVAAVQSRLSTACVSLRIRPGS